MVVRTQVSLDAEVHRAARRRASELGISFAEYVRRLVQADLAGIAAPQLDVSAVFDLGDGGDTDIAEDKERLLGEALAAAHPPRR